MSQAGGWSEQEARAAVAAYFELLKAEQDGTSINKTGVYRALSRRFPRRSAKAFELKLQNISAVLYEQRLPYCSGLKPRLNYQRLLRLLVLDQLDRTPLPAMEPHEILLRKLRELGERGPIPVKKKGAGRFGLAVEEALGIPQNSKKSPDFMGIELKTKTDGSLQTLFSRTPSRYLEDTDKAAMFRRHSHLDAPTGRRVLYTSFSGTPDTLGFRLVAGDRTIRALRRDTPVLEYDADVIEEALLSKLTHTAFLALRRGVQDGVETCSLDSVLFGRWPSVIRFLRLVSSGDVFLDFTLSEGAAGAIKDHGFLFRIRSSALEQLYLSSNREAQASTLPRLRAGSARRARPPETD